MAKSLGAEISAAVRSHFESLGIRRRPKLWFEHRIADDTLGGLWVGLKGRTEPIYLEEYVYLMHIPIAEAVTQLAGTYDSHFRERKCGVADSAEEPKDRLWTAWETGVPTSVWSMADIPVAIASMERTRKHIWGLDPASLVDHFERSRVQIPFFHHIFPVYLAHIGAKGKTLADLRACCEVFSARERREYLRFARDLVAWAGWDEEEFE